MWEQPNRNTWVNQLNLAIERADRPVVLVAHSLCCQAVAWWSKYEQPRGDDRVFGALLVALPEVEGADGDGAALDPRLTRFAPQPEEPLPFPSILVASRDDPYMTYRRAVQLARGWGSWLIDAGHAGYINAESALGAWQFGQVLLGQLLTGAVPKDDAAVPVVREITQKELAAHHL